MKVLLERIDALIEKDDLPWKRRGPTVTVEFVRNGRKQRVRISRIGPMYRFQSVVVESDFVKRSTAHWNRLAYRAWRKNALKEIITFAFDDEDRLIGLVEQPAVTVDPEEIRLYIETVARECDRFEYNLTGEDRE